MNEEFKEQRPLLSEDLSEEERFPEPRRYRPIYRGQAKNCAKGATAIIIRWPEYWSSSFTYWWIGLSMIALTIFIIYNSIIAFVLLPSVQMKHIRSQPDFNTPHLPEIFMHVLVNSDNDFDLNKYLPYIRIVSDKHSDYNFNLILLLNDTTNAVTMHSAEENNEIALNSLWSHEHLYFRNQNSRKNIKIRQITLSQYMDESPLRKDWRRIPPHFIEFLVKTISVWEKGGIAINPDILTPRSPNVIYIEKFHKILKKYKALKGKETVTSEPKGKKYIYKHKGKFKKKVNNIRDIINILEHEDDGHHQQENLTEVENVISPIVTHNGRKLLSTLQTPNNESKSSSTNSIVIANNVNDTKHLDHTHDSDIKFREGTELLQVENEGFEILDGSNETRLNLLPIFLEFLFHDKPTSSVPKRKHEESDYFIKHRKFVRELPKEKIKKNVSAPLPNPITNTEANPIGKYKPMIISAKGIVSNDPLKETVTKDFETEHDNPEELTVDLKGNILATKVSCHAFIGTIFSNIVHHLQDETLQDFIIAELSLFCKGLLSSCRGIDVILL